MDPCDLIRKGTSDSRFAAGSFRFLGDSRGIVAVGRFRLCFLLNLFEICAFSSARVLFGRSFFVLFALNLLFVLFDCVLEMGN